MAILEFNTWSHVIQDTSIDYTGPVSHNVDYLIMMNYPTPYILKGNYVQNAVDATVVDINMSIMYVDVLQYVDSVTSVGNTVTHGNFSTNTDLGEVLLEILAIKIFGNTKTRAAINNDNKFVGYYLGYLADSINIAINADKHHIFNQYVFTNMYSAQNLNDVTNGPVPFNFFPLALNIPVYLTGSVKGSANTVISDYNGPTSVNGSLVHNGLYNIPLMLQFHVHG